ncbi:ThiF family adenylyltransferase [Hymenobacter psychrophilus]|uniref:ThiF family protein n=1 Tax=Hymenobacter psychrophilus TaxID=651662 RepID=A0A1H3N3G2_9BACT|nr:ThiF family adenylyltransferase [Hymenobacter psychrophilus]SDY83376.1 ThiF family protein [Hymenobacter psychrophilus]
MNGEVITAKDLRNYKALALHKVLRQGKLPFVRLIELRRILQRDTVVIDVEPELPQQPVNKILPVERFAIVFSNKPNGLPKILSLRQAFPVVPHLNLTVANEPKDLCLSELPVAEQRLVWTPTGLLLSLRHWLRLTARGELHDATQALEPVFFPSAERVLVPSLFFSAGAQVLPNHLELYLLGETPVERTYGAYVPETKPIGTAASAAVSLLGFTYEASPQLHGLIQEQPQTLAGLHRLLSIAADDFIGQLRQTITQWATQATFDLALPLMGLVRVPKQRVVEAAAETTEVWAFLTTQSTREVGEALACWPDATSPIDDTAIVQNQLALGLDVPIALLNPVAMISPAQAAEYNGLHHITPLAYVVIGAGSLGSQLIANLHKAGQGSWTILDNDQLLPHNLPRHGLSGRHLGRPKAEALAEELNTLYELPTASYHVVDVLQDEAQSLAPIYQDANILLDTSASVAVARHLALDVTATARRISVFLNPSGSDVVVLAESNDRKLRLDYLEMEYYRALTQETVLEAHLLSTGSAIRYANGCRDKSSRIPQDQVALLAAVGARAVRSAATKPNPLIKIWQTQPDLTVTSLAVSTSRYRQTSAVAGWTLHISTRLMREMAKHRATRLKHETQHFRETGGVLLGAFDTQRRQIYIVDHITAPLDSQERGDSFIRGVEGLLDKVEAVKKLTNGQLDYVGEWHSHPPNNGTRPSTDDRKLFSWLCDHRIADGLPAVMAIAGDNVNISWYVDDLAKGHAHTCL